MSGEKRSHILIVDDNPTNLDFLVEYLKSSGFEISVAPSGERAIQHLEHILPDIILMDIMMAPGMDGFETCRRIKKNRATKDIPLIFMSGLSHRLDKVKGFYLGAVDYITKPFQQEEVLARIATHLALRREKKELAQINAKLFRLSSRLLELNTELSESKIAEDKFFSVLAHNMKHVFFSLMGASGMLRDSSAACRCVPSVGELAHSVDTYAKEAYKLLDELLYWSKLRIGEVPFQPQDIDLYDIVSDNISVLAESAEEKKIAISHAVKKNTLVRADPDMTQMIFNSLFFNVIKLGTRGGKIRITALSVSASSEEEDEVEEFVELSVSDAALSISRETLQEMFLIDKKYENIGHAGEEGIDISLILCKTLVEKNRGEIRIESEKINGSVFRVRLPGAKEVRSEK